jgi:hypothetical protein
MQILSVAIQLTLKVQSPVSRLFVSLLHCFLLVCGERREDRMSNPFSQF